MPADRKEMALSAELSKREKWFRFLAGKEVGPMVSPLCDDWSLDQPYRWPYDGPDPFPAGSPHHALSQQIAMAAICGWDPTFLASVPFNAENPDVAPQVKETAIAGGTHSEQRIYTPYGDLTFTVETKTSRQVIKPWLETREDFKRAIWLTEQQMAYDEDAAIQTGRALVDAVGERGVLGTWYGPPFSPMLHENTLFYQQYDWPELFDELWEVTRRVTFQRLETLRQAGFDYLFYCVYGTEMLSPKIFDRYVLEPTRSLFARWHELGGFVLWHSCGKVKVLVELGIYNELRPDVFETVSEPPVGDLPSLRWGRERLDPAIVTKGNIPLNVLLQGTEEEVRAEVRRVKEQTAGYRHVIGLSDDMFKDTPLRNCLAYVDEARRA
jgi:hypothetical protein